VADGLTFPVATANVELMRAVGRALLIELRLNRALPPADRALTRGFAVRAGETEGAGPYNPLPIAARPIQVSDTMPDGMDAVLPEDPFCCRAGCIRTAIGGICAQLAHSENLGRARDRVATLTHAAGISSTGDPVLDLWLPFDEPYHIPKGTAHAINRTKSRGKRVVAVGTTVVRVLESAVNGDGSLRVGSGIARGRICGETRLRIVDGILTGVHAPGESHFELLRAFASDTILLSLSAAQELRGYRTYEFGDSVLIERQAAGESRGLGPSLR
jgi:hypothetical protein